ncbi:MAG: formate/nitrite transporter family protein [Lachnospiraceae bacterium]|jgi:formate/nitrite transporter|nr:formate/nitrite transporter family protein [Lachnospiraceae bacterium]
MNLLTPAEITQAYIEAGAKKCARPTGKLLFLAVMAGLLIAFGGAVTNTASHTVTNVGAARTVSGLLFPFGLGMVVLLGAELFTGNCMIPISVLEKRATWAGMVRNWVLVYIGNFIGAAFLAAGCAFFGQLEYSSGALAVYTIKVAAAKCTLPFAGGVVLGFFCNVLVCMGVLCSLSAKDTTGRILGAYIPVAFFVICGFEHCVANMYYVPAGIFALQVPRYAQLSAEAGINTAALTWPAFIIRNLLPVTIGNILGGACVGLTMRYAHLEKRS